MSWIYNSPFQSSTDNSMVRSVGGYTPSGSYIPPSLITGQTYGGTPTFLGDPLAPTRPPQTWSYTKETVGSGSITNGHSTFPANSGMPGSGLLGNSSTSNYGQTPSGLYRAENCGVRTGGIERCDLVPIGHDALGRTHLQIHEKNPGWRGSVGLDSRGCIATEAVKSVTDGDFINVLDE